MRRMGLDRHVAVPARREVWTQPDHETCDPAQIRRDAVLLHAGVDQNVGRAQRDEIRQGQRRNGDMSRPGQDVDHIQRRLRQIGDHAVDFGAISIKRVVEGHAPSDDRRVGVMAENHAAPLPCQSRRDRGGDLVRAEDDDEMLTAVGEEFFC